MTRAATDLVVDSLVEGIVGQAGRVAQMRVTSISRSFVTGIGESGRQLQMYTGQFTVVGEPRPMAQRTDVPERFRA